MNCEKELLKMGTEMNDIIILCVGVMVHDETICMSTDFKQSQLPKEHTIAVCHTLYLVSKPNKRRTFHGNILNMFIAFLSFKAIYPSDIDGQTQAAFSSVYVERPI